MTRRRISLLLGLLLLIAGAAATLGPPRFTWLNRGLRIDYPWSQGTGMVAVSVGAALAGIALPRRSLRIGAWLVAAVILGYGLDLLVYRVEAADAAIVEHRLLGTTTIPWKDVARVETGSSALVVTDRDESQIRLRTGSFAPEDRARLERTIARRVREAGTAP